MKDKVANISKQKVDSKYLMLILSWRKYTFKKKNFSVVILFQSILGK